MKCVGVIDGEPDVPGGRGQILLQLLELGDLLLVPLRRGFRSCEDVDGAQAGAVLYRQLAEAQKIHDLKKIDGKKHLAMAQIYSKKKKFVLKENLNRRRKGA